jgi:hypothetical protein
MNTQLFASIMYTEKEGQCTYKHNIEVLSPKHYCRGKPISIKYYECVSVAFIIWHAKRMRRIVIVICLALSYFPHYLINDMIFERKKKLLNIKLCFDILYNFCLKHFSF